MPGELTAERASPLDVKRPVDRLVGDPHRLIVGVGEPQPAGDLLGRVVLSQAPFDQPSELGAELELRRARPALPAPGLAVRRVGAVAGPTAAAVDLPNDGRVGATEGPGDRARRVATGDPARDLLALFEAQRALVAPASPRTYASECAQLEADRVLAEPELAGDLALAQPLRP
jgi:hypothetical protein